VTGLVAFCLWHAWNGWILFNSPRPGTLLGCLASSLLLTSGWLGGGYFSFLAWEVGIAAFEVGATALLMSRLTRDIEEMGDMTDEVRDGARLVVRATAVSHAVRVAAAVAMVQFFL